MIPPGLERPLRLAAHRRERRGWLGDATVRLDPLTTAEADALDGLPWLGRRRPFLAGERPTVALARLEAALEGAGLAPRELYEQALGRPLRDFPAEARARGAARDAFREEVLASPPAATRPRLREWLARELEAGRLQPRHRPLVHDALAVVERLPARPPIDRAVLAAELFDGRPHALDADRPLERLARAMLAASRGLAHDAGPRAIWQAFGVEVDVTSSAVLALGLLPVGESALEESLRALVGTHVVLTLGQLRTAPPRWAASEVFVCENPSVLRAAERALGARCPPLVCGAGWPTDAVRALLRQLRDAGATLRYHGDFDPSGVAIFRMLEQELGARPWRYDGDAYGAALRRLAVRDLPPIPAAPRAPVGDLEAALAAAGRAIPEELAIPELLADLAAVARA